MTLRSPHSFLYVEVEKPTGRSSAGRSKARRPVNSAQQGIDKDAFKVGDPVEVIGNPSRSPNATRARLIKITRTTDGKSWGGGAGEV